MIAGIDVPITSSMATKFFDSIAPKFSIFKNIADTSKKVISAVRAALGTHLAVPIALVAKPLNIIAQTVSALVSAPMLKIGKLINATADKVHALLSGTGLAIGHAHTPAVAHAAGHA